MPNRLLVVAACALINRENRLLIAQRPEGKLLAGLWEFPGGKIEAGESPEDTIIRELQEELAITSTRSCLTPLTFASHRYPDFHLLMPLYVCREWRGTPKAMEAQQIAWVEIKDLTCKNSQYAMPPADAPLLPALQHYLSRAA
jgi:8-oxo-dGTP diphosphatase